MDLINRISNNQPLLSIPSASPTKPVWDPSDITNADCAIGWAHAVTESILNLNEDGTPLTKASALRGSHRLEWQTEDGIEICKLLDTGTMKSAHLKDANNKKKHILQPRLQREVQI